MFDKNVFKRLFISLGVLIAPLCLGNEMPAIPVDLLPSEDGLCIIEVWLQDPSGQHPPRRCRFMLDTGASVTAIDLSVPCTYFWNDPGVQELTDTGGHTFATERVLIKRLQAGGIVRDAVNAVRMDLRNDFGSIQDEPVDGVLGMTFLEGTRFVLDVPRRQVRWWASLPSPCLHVPFLRHPGRRPKVEMTVNSIALPAVVDTGSTGGFQVPMNACPSDATRPGGGLGMSGIQTHGRSAEADQIFLGSLRWRHVEVECHDSSEEAGLGLDLWSTGPVGFDFLNRRIVLPAGTPGDMPIRRPFSRSLPIAWNRRGATPFLKIIAVKPGSDMERAGCRVGDVLEAVGDLRGASLNRGNIMALVRSGRAHAWIVRRGGEQVRLAFPGNSAPGAGGKP